MACIHLSLQLFTALTCSCSPPPLHLSAPPLCLGVLSSLWTHSLPSLWDIPSHWLPWLHILYFLTISPPTSSFPCWEHMFFNWVRTYQSSGEQQKVKRWAGWRQDKKFSFLFDAIFPFQEKMSHQGRDRVDISSFGFEIHSFGLFKYQAC